MFSIGMSGGSEILDIVKKKKKNRFSDLSKLVVVRFLERNVLVVWLFMCESIEMVMVVVVYEREWVCVTGTSF